jgi:Flp pilus assembly protein TadD
MRWGGAGGTGQWGAGGRGFEEAVRRAPGSAEYLLDLGAALVQAGRPAAALDAAAEAEALGPTSRCPGRG